MTRKQFILSGSALTAVAVAGEALTLAISRQSYDTAASEVRRPIAEHAAMQRELVRYATLAPSSHNTQCWQFKLASNSISILPDFKRRCPIVDPDDHHLFVSMGCAAENLFQAALAQGLRGSLEFGNSPSDELRVMFEPTQKQISPIFEAIPARQCTRAPYDGTVLSTQELKLLEQAGKGEGVSVHFLTERAALENILEFVVAGNTAQIDNPAFVAELRNWIRFSEHEAVKTGDGLFSRTSGSPAVPSWLGNILFSQLYNSKTENQKYAMQMRSSAGVAVFVSEQNDKSHWIETGRCYERFALQATVLGIRNAMVNQPVEVSDIRPQLASYLGIGARRPDLVVRFGRGPTMPRSLRRSVDAVLI